MDGSVSFSKSWLAVLMAVFVGRLSFEAFWYEVTTGMSSAGTEGPPPMPGPPKLAFAVPRALSSSDKC